MANVLAYDGKLLVDQNGHVFKYGANTGSINITSNGTHDVNGKAYANVNVSTGAKYRFIITNIMTGGGASSANIQIKHNGIVLGNIVTDNDGIAMYECDYTSIDYYITYNNTCPISGRINTTDISSICDINIKLTGFTTHKLGTKVTFDNKEWVIVHDTGHRLYLMSVSSIGKSMINTSGALTTYRGSTLESVVMNYQNGMSSTALAMCEDIPIEDTSYKVFIPTYAQMGGGFKWFIENGRRKTGYVYWLLPVYTCNGGANVCYGFVNTLGQISAITSDSRLTSEYDIRVCIALQYKPNPIMEPVFEQVGDIINWDNNIWRVIGYNPANNRVALLIENPVKAGGSSYGSNGYDTIVGCNFEACYMSEEAVDLCVYDGTLITSYDAHVNKARTLYKRNLESGFMYFKFKDKRQVSNANTLNDIMNCYWLADYYSSTQRYYLTYYGDISQGSSPDVTNRGDRPYVVVQCTSPHPFKAPSSHTPGDVIMWDEIEWLVCHYDSTNNRVYMISKELLSTAGFQGSSYASSELRTAATSFKNIMSANALNMCIDVTVSGVTDKVFIPTYEQMNGGFSWFSDNNRRMVSSIGLRDTQYYAYWTSSYVTSPSSGIYMIDTDGSLYIQASTGIGHGVRPCVCVQL